MPIYIGIGNMIGGSSGGSWSQQYKPTGLTATIIPGGVQLDWDDNGYAYQVYGSLDGTSYSLLAGIHMGTHTYNHYMPGGLTMYYEVRSLNGTVVSSFSSAVSIYVTDIDAQNIIARMTALSEEPSAARKTNIDTTIKALKAANFYSEQFDQLLVSRSHGVASAKINLINQYETLTFGTKLTGQADEIVFHNVTELSNGDLLAGAGITSGHYWRSVDKGANWTDEGILVVDAKAIYDFCDCGGGVILAGIESQGIFADPLEGHICRSTDYGHTFTDLGRQFGHHYVTFIRRNPTTGILIAATEKSPEPLFANMLRSVDNGATWQECGNGGNDEITVMNMLQYCGGTTWIAGGGKDTGGGLFVEARMIRSTNDGVSWADLGLNLGGMAAQDRFFGCAYLENGIVLVGTAPNANLLRSTDAGATWTGMGAFFSQKMLMNIVNLGEGKVLAGTVTAPANGITAISDDYGLTWESLGVLSADQNVNDIKLLSDGNVILAMSTDGAIPAKIIKSTVRPFVRAATNTYDATGQANGGVLTFVADSGFLTDGTKSYVDSNWIPSVAASPSFVRKFKLNDNSFGFKVSGTLKATGYVIMGCADAGGRLLAIYGGANANTYNNNAAQSGSVIYEVGYNCISRHEVAGWHEYINDDAYDVTGDSVLLPDKKAAFLALNENNVIGYWEASTAVLEIGWESKFMTQAQFNAFRVIMNAYIAAL